MAMKTPSSLRSSRCAGLHVADDDAGDALRVFRAFDVFEHAVPHHFDLRVIEQALLQDLLGAEAVAAMDDRHLAREVREIERFFDGAVAAADDGDFLAAIEEAVAGRAGGYAVAAEILLLAGGPATSLARRWR